MRILLDSNVPYPLRRAMPGHTVSTATQLKWEELKNGDLLRDAEAASFDLMVTADQNLTYQQNLADREIALVVLRSNLWPLVKPHAMTIATAVDAATPNSYAFLEMPLPPKAPYTV